MSKYLGRIAIVSLTIGVASLALAYAFGGRDLARLFDRSTFSLPVMRRRQRPRRADRSDIGVTGDAIDIALPATVRYRSGEGSDIGARRPRGGRQRRTARWTSRAQLPRGTPRRAISKSPCPGRPLSRLGHLGFRPSGRWRSFAPSDLRVSISGSGSITAQGAVDNLALTVSGDRKARLGEVAVKQLTVEVSGSGNVEASPSDEADIRISGSGKVHLLTHPARLNSKISGSGRITQPPLEAAQGKK
jgi:hypothetical protein